jgi:hypothetical protein
VANDIEIRNGSGNNIAARRMYCADLKTYQHRKYVQSEKLNLYVGASETGRKAILWRVFLSCFAANTDTFVFPYTVSCLSCNVNNIKQ